jgi:AcrR family transcriptional regulator
MATLEEKRAQSISSITETALRLFSELGYEATSVRAIAREAGISLGLMYNYFSSKEELLQEIFRRSVEDIQASFLQDPDGPPYTSGIEQHIRHTVGILKEKRDFWKLLHSIRLQSKVVQQLLAEMQEETLRIEDRIQQNLLEAGIAQPELEAKLLFASIDGMAQHYLLYDNYPIDQVADRLIAKYTKQNQ